MRHHSIWKQNSWGLSPERPNRPIFLPLGESLISSFVFEAEMADVCGFLTAQGVEPLNPHCSRVNVLLSKALSRRTTFSNHFLIDLVPWRQSPRTRNSPGLGTPAQALTLRRHQGGSMQVSKEVCSEVPACISGPRTISVLDARIWALNPWWKPIKHMVQQLPFWGGTHHTSQADSLWAARPQADQASHKLPGTAF